MPKNHPGARYKAVAVRALVQGAPCVVDDFVGVAQKQVQPHASEGIGGSPNPQVNIPIAQAFVIITKGEVQVPFVTSAVKGSTVWINNTNDALTLTDPGSGNGRKFGRVTEIQDTGNVPHGFMLVDLDQKGTF